MVGLRYVPLMSSRLRYFGGTTNHWGGVCRPLETWDFRGAHAEPAHDWPIEKAALRDHYPRAADVCALAGFEELSAPRPRRPLPRTLDGAFEPRGSDRTGMRVGGHGGPIGGSFDAGRPGVRVRLCQAGGVTRLAVVAV